MEQQKQQSLLTKILLSLLLLGFIGLAIKIVVWAQSPQYCLVELNPGSSDREQILGVFEQYDVPFKTDSDPARLSVRLKDSKAIHHLVGPKVIELSDKAGRICTLFGIDLQPRLPANKKQFWQTSLYLKLGKLVVAGLIIITLILLVVRPLLRYLLYPDVIDEESQHDAVNTFSVGEEFTTPLWFGILGALFWSLLYCIALFITMAPLLLGRNDIAIIAISIVLPIFSFYQSLHGIMSAQYYWSTLVITKDGFLVNSRNSKKRIMWANVARVKIVTSSSVMHIYDKDGERVYSSSTDLEGTHRLRETISQRSKINC